MRTGKIVFIGAGSLSFGKSMLGDVFSCPKLKGWTLSLVDIDRAALERVTNVARAINAQSGHALVIESSAERRDVLPGADFVVCALAIERCELWKQDFLIPKKHGIRHTLGENGGPGALFFTLRTLPVIMDIARDMRELCPEAAFLNFSNPESRIILALGRYFPGMRSVGLCHGIFMGQRDTARITGRPPESVDARGAGLNHFQFLTDIRDSATGEDLYPLLREKDAGFDPGFQPLSRKLFRAFGLYPSCSDDHIGEYLPFGYEAGEEGYDFDAYEARRARLSDAIAQKLAAGGWGDWLRPSGERAVQVMTGLFYNGHTPIESGIVYNRGVIANLPADAAVEVPLTVDASGIHPQAVGCLPAGIARILTQQVLVQQMAVDAAAEGSRELALQALLVDPVVNSTDAALRILAELWPLNEPYIRRCV